MPLTLFDSTSRMMSVAIGVQAMLGSVFMRSCGRAMRRGINGRGDETAKMSPRTLLFETKPFWSHRKFSSKKRPMQSSE